MMDRKDEDAVRAAAFRRLRERQEQTEQTLAEVVRRAQETGELRHLYGKPLDLSDTGPGWFMRRALQREGFTHPALERAREVDALYPEVADHIDRLRRYRDWIANPASHSGQQEVDAFNKAREEELEAYRALLRRLNQAIQNYNLGVPDALQRIPVRINEEVARLAAEIPPLQTPPPPVRPARFVWLRRLCHPGGTSPGGRTE